MTDPTLENEIGQNEGWKPDEDEFLVAKQKECLKKNRKWLTVSDTVDKSSETGKEKVIWIE